MCPVPPKDGAGLAIGGAAIGGAAIRDGEATLAEGGAAIPGCEGALKLRGPFPGGLLKILCPLLGTPVEINAPPERAPMPPKVRPWNLAPASIRKTRWAVTSRKWLEMNTGRRLMMMGRWKSWRT